MSNETYNINCPHCNNELSVDTSFQGLDVTCPLCNKDFVVPQRNTPPSQKLNLRLPSQQKKPANTANQAAEQSSAPSTPPPASTQPAAGQMNKQPKGLLKDYIWGRLYILLSWILALLVVLGGLTEIIKKLYRPFEYRSEAFSEVKSKQVPKLVEKQKEFQSDYSNIAKLVMMGNNDKAKFKFTQDLATPPGFFNEKLLTTGDVQESKKILALYEEKITKMSDIMHLHFSTQYKKLQGIYNKGNALNLSWTKKTAANKSSALHLSFGNDANFYDDTRNNVSKEISAIKELLYQLKPKKNSSLRHQNELKKIMDGINFIEKHLNSKEKDITIGRNNSTGAREERKTVKVGEDQYKMEKEYLADLIIRLGRLTSSSHKNYYRWSISHEADKLEASLNAHEELIEEINKNFKKQLKAALLDSGFILLIALLSAFMLLVFADYLRAHFDSAVSLKSIDSKIKLFILLPLFAFLIGCGPSPEEVLKNNMTNLKSTVVNSMFAEQIAKNPDATAYVKSGEELILISGGTKNVSFLLNGSIAAGASYYNVSHINCNANLTHSAITEVDKSPYTHKAQLQVNFQFKVRKTDNNINSAGTPGLEFHTLTPETYNGQKDRWIDIRMNEIPNSQYDHAVAIHNISRYTPSTIPVNKLYEIFYNPKTKQWCLDQNTKLLANMTPPPVYSESQHTQIMQGYQYRKFVARNKETQQTVNYWVRANDYDILDKIINKGLIRVNGVWKDAVIVRQTENLKSSMASWDAKDMVSLSDVEELLLKPIEENPRAEQKQQAVEKATKALLAIFLRDPKGNQPEEKDRRRLKNALDFIKNNRYMKVLDQQKLLETAQEKLNQVDNYFKDKAAREAAKRAQEAKQRAEERARMMAKCNELKAMATKLKQAIENYYESPNVNKLLNELKQSPDFMNNEKYKELVNSLEHIVNIAKKRSYETNKLFRDEGRYKDFTLLMACNVCNSSGLRNCKLCNNTGRCHICEGSGRREATEHSISNGRFVSRRGYAACPTKCRSCQGRTLRCMYCWGQGRKLDNHALEEAFRKELSDTQALLDNILAELNKIIL